MNAKVTVQGKKCVFATKKEANRFGAWLRSRSGVAGQTYDYNVEDTEEAVTHQLIGTSRQAGKSSQLSGPVAIGDSVTRNMIDEIFHAKSKGGKKPTFDEIWASQMKVNHDIAQDDPDRDGGPVSFLDTGFYADQIDAIWGIENDGGLTWDESVKMAQQMAAKLKEIVFTELDTAVENDYEDFVRNADPMEVAVDLYMNSEPVEKLYLTKEELVGLVKEWRSKKSPKS